MKYCPLCRSEYVDQVSACATCIAPLVRSLSAQEVLANPPRLLWRGKDLAEFELVSTALREAGIPALLEERPRVLLAAILAKPSEIYVLTNDFAGALDTAHRWIEQHSREKSPKRTCHQCQSLISPSLTACPSCKTLFISESELKELAERNAVSETRKYCPMCGAEYAAAYERCSVCGSALVAEQFRGRPLTDAEKSDRLELVWRGGDPVALSRAVALLRNAGIRHHVQACSDHLVFELAMPLPKYNIRVLHKDSSRAFELLAAVQDPPFFGYKVSPDFPENGGQLPQPREASPKSDLTTQEVWTGGDVSLACLLQDCFAENRITCKIGGIAPGLLRLSVLPRDEARAREIIRQVLEGAPSE